MFGCVENWSCDWCLAVWRIVAVAGVWLCGELEL